MKTRLLAMGAFLFASALVACGGGGGGGGGSVNPPPPTNPPANQVTLSSSSTTTTPMPATAGYSGTMTFPAGSGTLTVSTSTSNPSGVVLQSRGSVRIDTSTPNPFGCIGSTPYAAAPRRVAVPVHPIAGGDTFSYTGSLATTYSESAPCPQPTATSSATVTDTVTASATAPPIGASDLRSTENDAFPTLTSTTYTDQIVTTNSTGSTLTEYEIKQSDPNNNSLDEQFGTNNLLNNPQLLDQGSAGNWSNNPTATITETLADGTSDTRHIAADGSYTDTETFPNNGTATIAVNGAANSHSLDGSGTYNVAGATFAYGVPQTGGTTRQGLLYIGLYAQTNVSASGTPGLTLNVPSNITGNLYLAILQNNVWTTIAGPTAVSNGTVTFAPGSGAFSLNAGQTAYIAVFQNVVNPNPTITLTITQSSGSKQRSFPAWFTVPSSYITDNFVETTGANIDTANCHVASGVPTMNLNKVVETRTQLDPVLGYTDTRTTTNYYAPGFGAVCVVISDTLSSYYDYQNSTTLIDYQSTTGNPNSVSTLTESLSMQTPTNAYSSIRKQSAQGVSPLAVAQAAAAIQLKRDVQRAQEIRALHDVLSGNRGADL